MKRLMQQLKKMAEYQKLLSLVEDGVGVAALYGMSPIHKAQFAAALSGDVKRPLLIVTRDEQSAKRQKQDFESFTGGQAALLPCRDLVFHNIDNVSREYEQQRLGALDALARGQVQAVFAPADALMLHTLPPQALLDAALTLELGRDYPMEELAQGLVQAGYTRSVTVEGPGQFALRGGILDVFPAGGETPVRAEFFGDTVDSLGAFDPMTQRRSENLESVRILPARETLPQLMEGGVPALCALLGKLAQKAEGPLKATLLADQEKLAQGVAFAACDRYLPYLYEEATAFSYLPEGALVILDDTPAVLETARGVDYRHKEDVTHLLESGVLPPSKRGYSLGYEQFYAALLCRQLLLFDSFLSSGGFSPDAILSLNLKQLPSYGGSLDTAVSDLESYLSMRYTVFALAGGQQRAQNLRELLASRSLPCVSVEEEAGPGRVCVLPGNLSAGFEYPSIATAVITEGQMTARRAKSHRKTSSRDRVKSFTDLTPGDLVVHEHHGIGRFVGVERIQVDGVYRDYIKIAYAGTDFVFVPATSLDLVSKYIGNAEVAGVKLSKLGGTTWAKTKSRAKKAAQDLAEGLIALYAARKSQPGFAFAPDDDWQRSFEEAFPYDETEDQLACAREIKRDMQRAYPMDRLLCGDVGFGKTEVAFRAVMKCVLSGKQAAILVPTTVLARQHYITAKERFAGYPVKIDMLSRFRTPGQQRETLSQVRAGGCDILVGTHRILQKDVGFKDLGLLIVDEEQRFGVTHKEAIKQMTKTVDVLTLTATPIPRTLNMALSGIRDMSVLEEPPLGRQPVQTYVLEHDETIVRDAIRRELARSGQVYYLHNRIDSIEQTASRLRAFFPDAVIATAHGRMSEEQMSDIMGRAYAGEIDVLVCTTIIETGVDIPNVNTLIIEDADHMGLAQLHQIRGRVGRSPRHAYAYLTYRRGKVLTEISQKRLSAIREFAEFGSGFKIAMRDLEIRGAGNVLGPEQSGHMMSVGYDMYLKLLEEASSELTGQKTVSHTECTADILVSASLPEKYVPDAATRVDLYRRIAMIRSQEDYSDMQDELIDRFGDIPRQAQALLDIALLRSKAAACGVSEISHKGTSIQFHFHHRDLERASKVCGEAAFRGRMLLNAGEKPYFSLRLKTGDDPLRMAALVIDRYEEL